MHPNITLDFARERQIELRREAREARAHSSSHDGVVGVSLRRGMAHTLRRLADQIDHLDHADAPRLIDLR